MTLQMKLNEEREKGLALYPFSPCIGHNKCGLSLGRGSFG